MNLEASSVWLYEMAFLAIIVAVIVAIAAVLERWLTSAEGERNLWQACTVTLLAFTLVHVSGAGDRFGALVRGPFDRRPKQAVAVSAERTQTRPVFNATPNPELQFAAPAVPQAAARPAPQPASERAMLWFFSIWAIGFVALALRFALSRLVFFWFSFRGRAIREPALLAALTQLSQQLGIRRRVRMIEFPRLQAPIAFGLFRPAVGVPPGFSSKLSPAEREVMLAHELMHIAARDGFWYALADVTVALLWWHPAVWYSWRKLRHASEVAADEASLLVENGPAVLADCLVRLGEQIRRPGSFAPMGVTGFRSGLGRRVHALLNVRSRACVIRRSFAKFAFPAAVVPLLVICSAFTFDHRSMKGAHMTSPNWKRSLPTVALLAFLSSDVGTQAADSSAKPAAVGPAKPETRRANAKRWSGATRIREKLGRIVLDQLRYDNLPLTEVIRQLMEEARRRDPEEIGINFLIVNSTAPSPSIDPATGLPIPGSAEPVDIGTTTIKIDLPLSNVRLIDALDAIVKVADRPLRYAIQDYGVVFSADPAAGQTEQLVTETFQIEADIFFKGIESAFGIDVPRDTAQSDSTPRSALLKLSMLKVKQAEQELQDVKKLADNGTASSTELRRAENALETARLQLAAKEEEVQNRSVTILPNRETQQQIFRELFGHLGVRLEPPKSAFFNELTGIMMVRVTYNEMEAIRPAIETLGGTPTSKLAANKQ